MDISHLESRLERLESRVSLLENGVSQKVSQTHSAPEPQKNRVESHSGVSVESFIGGRVLLRAGVIAVLAAVGFFLKYAFEQHLLSDILKVVVIALFGCVMIVLGEYFAKKHRIFGHVIVGGGIAVWFFDVIAANALYNFISPLVALVLALLLTVVMLVYSVKRESHPLLIASLLGAYLAPLFFNISGIDLAAKNGFALYSLIVTLGAFWFLQRKREWTMYFLFPIIGFGIHLLGWMSDSLVSTGLMVIGVEYAVALLFILDFWQRSEFSEEGASALFLTQTLFTALLIFVQGQTSHIDSIVPVFYAWAAGLISLGLWILYSKRGQSAPISLLSNTVVVFLALSIINYFVELRIVYFLLMLAICSASFAAITRKVSIAITTLAISFLSLILFVGYSHIFETLPIFSIWFSSTTLLLTLLTIVFAFQAWLVQFHRSAIAHIVGGIAFLLAQFTAMFFMFHQIDLLIDAGQKKDILYSIALILYGAINVSVGFIKKSQPFRLVGLVVLGIAIMKVAFVDLWGLGTLYRIAVSLVLGILLISSSFLYHKFSDTLRKEL